MHKLRVLIVDDNKDFAESLAMFLEDHECDVEIAFSGDQAVSIFRKKDFDISFIDIKMPGKNGVESLIEIRKIKPDAKIVMMTGFSVEQLLEQALKEGAYCILHKPLKLKEILSIMDDIKPSGILIVDDDPDFVSSLQDILSAQGYKSIVAENGVKALEIVKKNVINLIILDLKMSALSGIDTYTQLKKEGVNIPTVVVTAYPDDFINEIEEFKSMKISGILTKPFDPSVLLEVMESLLARKPSL